MNTRKAKEPKEKEKKNHRKQVHNVANLFRMANKFNKLKFELYSKENFIAVKLPERKIHFHY